ncbi:PTS system, glucose subfamily, IIA subunit [Xylanimonas cellulosilytica DSM 15894]|uniref:PTS system, glucose subfamily, IIA subunit n=1 Tax=Xylanimonas cellulosilytica (strain DSM 15894 / JCM 12276 / CECT 5975 / KCTC 9989 / LMG 20990 / NBRC 107835 / XIL07) TaxID=446471 RepID=D1C0K0_XYLCX|nr:PTS glucose transporter subunit IIA [Xylanimonas cellulosilytica]ACZ32203.1 PTS system, glucose subfamily, IIA subunit [Xylanimonas cellulosilytica DSM 15894]
MPDLEVRAPVAGTVVAVADIPDPVFAAALVGPGSALAPDPVAGRTAVAPIAGVVVKLHPHAFVVAADDGRAVLVHLGIDTVELHGDGFTLHVAEGDRVEAGQPVVDWDPAAVEAGGRSPVVPVVVLDAEPSELRALAPAGTTLTPSDPLFSVT